MRTLSAPILFRAVSASGVVWRKRRGKPGEATGGGRDKSVCPEYAKPLTWLVFSSACRSVAGMLPDFGESFQCSRMHRPLAILLEAWP